MSGLWMIVAAIVLLCVSGLPAVGLPAARCAAGQRLALALMLIGSVTGVLGLAVAGAAPVPPAVTLPWFLPWGRFALRVDAVSSVFLLPVLIVPALGSLYGMRYWKNSEHPENGRRLVLAYGVLAGSMALVVIARDAVLFLIAWEIMALAAFFAATAEDDNPEVCRAGWVYLVATHAGTLSLIALFALWHQATRSFALDPAQGLSSGMAGAIFGLALVGFGFKAGIMPLHLWLPGAHANAPSHVSAVMSGVMLKMGVYGIVRITALLEVTDLWWGCLVMGLGAVTGVAGIAFALAQSDIKRALAYSSIENIGIIMIGIGLALIGRAVGQPLWIMLGMGGALLHLWNHSLFKSLLFFGAGAVIHALHTRNLDQMGGLAKRMPQTAALFAVGAVAICALPPLNGFAGEWLLYCGVLQTLGIGGGAAFPAAAIAVIPLAMIGALAVACFVKIFGTVFLGSDRGGSAHHAHDPSLMMRLPMILTALGCIWIGLFPMTVFGPLARAAAEWAALPAPEAMLAASAPLLWISGMGLALILLAVIIACGVRRLLTTKSVCESTTWECGYTGQSRRIQYTGSSFGHTLVQLFAFLLRPRTEHPDVRGLFPGPAVSLSGIPDLVLDRLVLPLFRLAARYLPALRVLQQGQTQVYVLYILIIVVTLLIFGALGVQA